jgi:hypothetical protein
LIEQPVGHFGYRLSSLSEPEAEIVSSVHSPVFSFNSMTIDCPHLGQKTIAALSVGRARYCPNNAPVKPLTVGLDRREAHQADWDDDTTNNNNITINDKTDHPFEYLTRFQAL